MPKLRSPATVGARETVKCDQPPLLLLLVPWSQSTCDPETGDGVGGAEQPYRHEIGEAT
jgi:hypothetical protein